MSDSTDPNATSHGIVLSQRAYDLVKDLDLIALPTLGTATGGFLKLYGASDQVIGYVAGTIAFIIVVLGILLKISNIQYKANAKVAAVKAASLVSPTISVSPTDPTKIVVAETQTGPGIAADPKLVEVDPPSQ